MDVIAELREIAERSAEASERGGPEADLLDAYATLRERTLSLARRHGLSTTEELVDLRLGDRRAACLRDARGRLALNRLAGGASAELF